MSIIKAAICSHPAIAAIRMQRGVLAEAKEVEAIGDIV